jgi:hypothetical protein
MNILEKLLSQPHPLAKHEEPPKITPTNKVQPPKTEAEIRKEKKIPYTTKTTSTTLNQIP